MNSDKNADLTSETEVGPRRGYSPIIKNLMPGLAERGKIKIGRKGDERQKSGGGQGTYQVPVKLNHFVVTTLERGKDNNFLRDEGIHAILKTMEPKRVPIRLLYDDIALNFQCRYVCYKGKQLHCSGDGECAHEILGNGTKKEIPCPCERQSPTFKGELKCKISGRLSVLIDGADAIGGVWVFRTTSYNSVVSTLSSLSLIKSLTGGILAGIPLALTIAPKVATNPIDGRSLTIQVVAIEFSGDLAKLRQSALQIAQGSAEYRHRLINVEDEVKKLISVDADFVDQAGDIAEEFYPDDDDEGEDAPQIVVDSDGSETVKSAQGQAIDAPAQGTATASTPASTTKKRGRKPGSKNKSGETTDPTPAQAVPVQAPVEKSEPAARAEPAPARAAQVEPDQSADDNHPEQDDEPPAPPIGAPDLNLF